MNTNKDGGSAFPITLTTDRDGMPIHPGAFDGTVSGMTLRDYFAAKAMQSLTSAASGEGAVALEKTMKSSGTKNAEAFIAKLSYAMADAMLAERLKTNGAE